MSLQKIKFLLLALLGGVLLCLPAAPAHSDSDIFVELSKETRSEVNIAVPQFVSSGAGADESFAEKSRNILENDLRLFELFVPMAADSYSELARSEARTGKINYAAWSQLGAQWVIKGQYEKSLSGNKYKFVFRLFDVVNEQFLVGKRYQGKKSFMRKIMHRFADEAMEQLTGKRGVAETRLAFLSRTPDGKEMYAVDFDGANVQKLTDEQSVILSPDWSPNGRFIVYTSFKDRNPDLILLNPDGRRKRRPLLKLPGINSAPAWSPDGTKISLVLSKDGNSEIYVLDRWRKLTRLTRHFNIDTSPTWSPDGKEIAFTSDRSGTGPQIYIMDSTGGDRTGVRRITFNSRYNDNPAWSPNGDKIAYTSMVKGNFQIRIYNTETRKTADVTSGRGSKEEPTWSPDGQFLAYRKTRGRQSSIHIKRIGGKKSRQLTFLPEGGVSPTWSPYPKR
jgi:TolB protein